MLRIDTVLGNVHEDESLAEEADRHEERGTLERVVIDAADRKKSRLRVTTDAGTELGVVVDRPELAAGDVLYRDDRMIVVAFEPREAFAVELPAGTSPAAAAKLGHRVGNQHWGLATEGRTLYVSTDADRRIVEDVLADSLPTGARTGVETVDPTLFVDDRSAGAPGDDHSHADRDHDHAHGGDHDDHGHSHDHARGGRDLS